MSIHIFKLKRSSILLIGVLFLFSTLTLASSEFLVRFKKPKNVSIGPATFEPFKRGFVPLGSEYDVINEEEGLVRLKFMMAKDAEQAQEELSLSPFVSHLAPNLTYRPALHYRFQEVPGSLRDSFSDWPLSVYSLFESFLSDSLSPVLPSVPYPTPFQQVGEDPLVEKDWALKSIRLDRVNFDEILVHTSERPSVLAAVIDTGIDYTHEDLMASLWRETGVPTQVGYDFVHQRVDPYDVVQFDVAGCLKDVRCRLGLDTNKFLVNPGHGTHCAGHMASVYKNSLGIRGVGSNAKIMGLKFFYDAGEEKAGGGDDASAIKAIDYAIQKGVKVINASWGSRHLRSEGEQSELKNALIRARDAGVLVVIAAGNDGINQDSAPDPAFPAAYPLDNLIVVAAVDSTDALASFSNYGVKSVHLGAPGVKILSTIVGSQYSDLTARVVLDSGKVLELAWDGTSMAAPLVAGAVALVWSKYPQEGYQDIRHRILNSARKVSNLEGVVSTGGVLDVAALMQ